MPSGTADDWQGCELLQCIPVGPQKYPGEVYGISACAVGNKTRNLGY